MEQRVIEKSVIRSLSRYVAAFFAVILALNAFLIYFINRSYRAELSAMQEAALSQALEHISNEFTQAQSVLYSVRHQENVVRLLEGRLMPNAERIPLLRYEILPFFDSILAWTTSIRRVRLLHADEALPSLYDSLVYIPAFAQQGYAAFLDTLVKTRDTNIYMEHLPEGISYFPTLDKADTTYTINLYLPIYKRNTLSITALAQVSLDARRLLSRTLDAQSPAFLLDEGGALLWSNGLLPDEEALRLGAQLQAGGRERWDSGQFAVSQYSDTLRATLFRVVPLDFLAGSPLLSLFAAMSLLLLLILGLLTVHIYRPFGRQLQMLVTAMNRIRATGDYAARVTVSGDNELTLVSLTFNDLLDNTQALMERIIASGNAEKQAVYAALSNQIRPHFLNNALDRIRMIAQTHGEADIARTLEQIMRYLRYNLGNQSVAVSLGEELENVADYVRIFTLSRGDGIELCMNVQGSVRGNLHAFSLPKFTLLPLVENCIRHGFAQARPVMRIIITIQEGGDMLLIQVEDNGNGIEPGRLEEIRASLTGGDGTLTCGDRSGGIGLSLVRKRLMLHYGKAIDLTIESDPDTGTQVSLSVPASRNTEVT